VTVTWSGVASVALEALFATPSCFATGSDARMSSDGGVLPATEDAGNEDDASALQPEAGSPSVCLGPDAGPFADHCLIDTMNANATVFGGYWYTFSDRTLPNTITLVPNPAGTISPLEGAEFPPDMTGTGGPSVPGMDSPANFRRFSGAGLTLWGAGMGFDWQDVSPADAGASDAADAGPALGVPVAFDASAHSGIGFYGRSSTGASQIVGVHFSDKREAVAGGLCDADASFTIYEGGADTNNSPTECNDDFLKNVSFTQDWSFFIVKFADARQGFADGYPLAALDPTTLFQVHFQVNNHDYAGSGPVAPEPAWDISVATITWYDGP
jgi:hypothetical protein